MKSLYKIGVLVLLTIYLVIVAGSVVRMTGSGMGCPDWPKCFGYIIPPTNESQIVWKKNSFFRKNQMVVHEVSLDSLTSVKQLLVANKDFTSTDNFDLTNWHKYKKHDYAVFNVFHTWTEYINRLMGALLGLFALLMLAFSIKHWKQNKRLTFLSLAQLFFIGFEAWLGKLTVDANLAPVTITYHMLGVIVLIGVQLYFLRLVKNKTSKIAVNWYYLIPLAIGLLILQIILGTQVRQEVDTLLESGISRSILSENFSIIFYVHRSFSILLLAIIGFICWKLIQINQHRKTAYLILVFLLLEIGVGMFLFYLGMKAYGQPFHLLFSLILYGFLIYLGLNYKKHAIEN